MIYWLCHYCKARFSERELLKQHLLDDHYSEMEEFGKLHNQIPNWAAGYKAAFCGYDECGSKRR